MCGICGKFAFSPLSFPTEQEIAMMCAVMAHRGPNSQGVRVDGPVGLGIRRLSIIDLVSGDQPIANEDESIWVVFNLHSAHYRRG